MSIFVWLIPHVLVFISTRTTADVIVIVVVVVVAAAAAETTVVIVIELVGVVSSGV